MESVGGLMVTILMANARIALENLTTHLRNAMNDVILK
ncbi:MAG: hypothetical protein ACI8RD_003156 [Bacillariaceae sp.]|jgi:hypothetical protein